MGNVVAKQFACQVRSVEAACAGNVPEIQCIKYDIINAMKETQVIRHRQEYSVTLCNAPKGYYLRKSLSRSDL